MFYGFNMKSEAHTFSLDNETFQILDRYSKKRKISKSAVLRILISDHLGEVHATK